MKVTLKPLNEEEMQLLLQLLQANFGSHYSKDWKMAKGVAEAFFDYANQHGRDLALPPTDNTPSLTDPIKWLHAPEKRNVRGRAAQVRSANMSSIGLWRRLRRELARIIIGSQQEPEWGFAVPVVVPTGTIYVMRPGHLVIDWLLARLVANGQQFRLVPKCKQCRKAGLRARSRKQNAFCSEACKHEYVTDRRRRERAMARAERGNQPTSLPASAIAKRPM